MPHECDMSDKETTENFRVGSGKPGPGRPKGLPNRATVAVREAIAAFAEANAPKLQVWLDEIAAKNPEKAADLFLRALEYHVPRLARTECIGENGGPVSHSIQITFGDPRFGEHHPPAIEGTVIEPQARIEPAESHRLPASLGYSLLHRRAGNPTDVCSLPQRLNYIRVPAERRGCSPFWSAVGSPQAARRPASNRRLSSQTG
jgi:hypothetical protein